MNLLGAKLYDPAAAVSKATSALLAMTAFDTTNLRLAITVPAHGMVRFRLTAIRAALLDNLDAAISSRSTFAGGAVASVTGAVGSVTGITAADVGAIKAKTDNLPSDPADQSLIIGATDVIRADIAAIPSAPSAVAVATQVLASAAANPIASNLSRINGTTILGDGSATPFGP